MPIYWKLRVKEGWKKEENKREGPCLVLIACNEATDKEMFHYAPNLVDEAMFINAFEQLKVLDELNKGRVKAYETLLAIDKEVEKFENSINTTQTSKAWNDTCRLKQEKVNVK